MLIKYIVNLFNEDKKVKFDISNLNSEFKQAEVSAVFADNLLDMNTMENPEAIKHIKTVETLNLENYEYAINVPKYSFTEIKLGKAYN